MPMKEPTKRPRMEFSKKLIILATVIFAATWVIAVFSWFYFREAPAYLLRYSHLLYGASCCSYYCKTAYENKQKIARERLGVKGNE